MLKAHILATCSHCYGEARQHSGEDESCPYQRYINNVHCLLVW